MKDFNSILEALERKASEADASAAVYRWVGVGKGCSFDPPAAQRAACHASQAAILREFAAELKAALPCAHSQPNGAGNDREPDQRAVFVSEMGGEYTATIIDSSEAQETEARYREMHSTLLENTGEANCGYDYVVIPARSAEQTEQAELALIDERYVVISDFEGLLRVSIHNIWTEAEHEANRLREEWADWVKEGRALFVTCSVIVPFRK